MRPRKRKNLARSAAPLETARSLSSSRNISRLELRCRSTTPRRSGASTRVPTRSPPYPPQRSSRPRVPRRSATTTAFPSLRPPQTPGPLRKAGRGGPAPRLETTAKSSDAFRSAGRRPCAQKRRSNDGGGAQRPRRGADRKRSWAASRARRRDARGLAMRGVWRARRGVARPRHANAPGPRSEARTALGAAATDICGTPGPARSREVPRSPRATPGEDPGLSSVTVPPAPWRGARSTGTGASARCRSPTRCAIFAQSLDWRWHRARCRRRGSDARCRASAGGFSCAQLHRRELQGRPSPAASRRRPCASTAFVSFPLFPQAGPAALFRRGWRAVLGASLQGIRTEPCARARHRTLSMASAGGEKEEGEEGRGTGSRKRARGGGVALRHGVCVVRRGV